MSIAANTIAGIALAACMHILENHFAVFVTNIPVKNRVLSRKWARGKPLRLELPGVEKESEG
jgi:hypothetical protein